VAAGVLEDQRRAHPLISQAMVVGDAKPFIAALITIDPEAFAGWKQRNGKPSDASVGDLANDPDLTAEVVGRFQGREMVLDEALVRRLAESIGPENLRSDGSAPFSVRSVGVPVRSTASSAGNTIGSRSTWLAASKPTSSPQRRFTARTRPIARSCPNCSTRPKRRSPSTR